MTSHVALDHRSLELHRLVVERIREKPALFEKVRRTNRRYRAMPANGSEGYVEAWQRQIDRGMNHCLAKAVEESEEATAMRQASPFAGILPEDERRAFLMQWKRRHDPDGA